MGTWRTRLAALLPFAAAVIEIVQRITSAADIPPTALLTRSGLPDRELGRQNPAWRMAQLLAVNR